MPGSAPAFEPTSLSTADAEVQALLDAQDCIEAARADLAAHSLPEEAAELDMNLGLVFQSLVGAHCGRIQDAIAH